MSRTNISWATHSWNPIVGCSKASLGCERCYAERMAQRLKAMGRPEYQDVVDENGWTGRVDLVLKRLEEPIHWRPPKRVFVCSMADLFHESLRTPDIHYVLSTMDLCPQITFMVLTKRAERMREEVTHWNYLHGKSGSLKHVWLGVSVENQHWADIRIPLLLDTPAAIRWVSYEPALGPIDPSCLTKGISWCIVGGESGFGRRPFKKEWAISVRDHCVSNDIAFFFKQGTSQYPGRDDLLEGQRYKEWPQ